MLALTILHTINDCFVQENQLLIYLYHSYYLKREGFVSYLTESLHLMWATIFLCVNGRGKKHPQTFHMQL